MNLWKGAIFLRIYIVQKGDTLFKIAQKHKVSVEEIIRLNTHIANPDYIMPGMKIKLPKQMLKAKNEKKDSSQVKGDVNPVARTHERPLGSVAEMEDRGGGDSANRVPLNREPHDLMQTRREKENFEEKKLPRKQSKLPQEHTQGTEQGASWQESYHTKLRMEEYSQELAKHMHKEWPPLYMDSRQLPFCPCCMYHWQMQQMMLEYEKNELSKKRYPSY